MPFLPLAGNSVTDPMTGAIVSDVTFTNPILGSFTGGFLLNDATGNAQLSGFSNTVGCPLIGATGSVPNGIFFLISGAKDVFQIGNGGTGQPNFAIYSGNTNAGIENPTGGDHLWLYGSEIELGYVSGNIFHVVTGVYPNTVQITSGIPLQWNADAGFSRLAPYSVALGNGTQGDVTGSITLANLILSSPQTPASNAAGTNGQLAYGTVAGTSYIYVCIASGNWQRATLTAGY
jgi:hypothetical protein